MPLAEDGGMIKTLLSDRADRSFGMSLLVLSQTLLGVWFGYDRWRRFQRNGKMIEFKGSHFERDVILWGVRWYVAYPISYRQLEEMMEERGVEIDHSTLNRWVSNTCRYWISNFALASIRSAPAGEWTRHM